MKLNGSCHCGAVKFSVESHTPYPYMRCYCSICRKTALRSNATDRLCPSHSGKALQ